MKKPILFSASAIAIVFLTGCATSHQVSSSAVTSALDLSKTDRFDLNVVDTSRYDTAFSDNAQEFAGEALVYNLESDGLNYVGESEPEISFTFKTFAATKPSYLNPSADDEVEIITTETNRISDGTTIETKTVKTVDVASDESIYMDANSRLFLLEAYDEGTDALLWRGYTTIDDTGLTEEVLVSAIDLLTERLDEET
ncbi:hypothetical protein [Pelagicoccus albus]|uniref:DUF4136 domain-containing protein n=1 Tax=Pelagicoccus albus TaxID=415222 RepID=A0A7X1B4P5_9BACT|nr:hypothetical protein [Pelagicoccus albus]MBC2605576.1 hypothetical protein [Pelagicoccus albus]